MSKERTPRRINRGNVVRDAEVLEARVPERPYLVRWEADGRGRLNYPEPDAGIEHFPHGSADGVVSACTTPVDWFQQ